MLSTIALVTALPVEGAALRLLIQDPHRVQIPDDPNHYECGWLPSADSGRPHPVVTSVLPFDGTRTAAAVCSELLRSFPTVRCIVMCGIAGGIPAPADPSRQVRLGDIVVATAGVIDYGHVWRIDGTDELRRPVDGMSMQLLRAAVQLQGGEQVGLRPWESWLVGAPERFQRPGPGHDPLAGADRPHRPGFGPGAGLPRVHYGAIGSGDQLVQDARRRDELAARHHILAVEMEASGVAAGAILRGAHWFVVRGVADYCDTGKNAVWQPFAALAAASYVRALLAACPSLAPPAPAPNGAGAAGGTRAEKLRRILDVLQTVPPLRDDLQRQEFLAQLPGDIRASIPYHSSPRMHLLAAISACEQFPAGRDAFLEALRVSLPPTSADLGRCEQVIAANWLPDGGR